MTKLSYFTDSIFRATARFCLCLFYGYFLISVLTSINYNPIQEGKENINKSRGRLRPGWLAVSLPAPDQIQAVTVGEMNITLDWYQHIWCFPNILSPSSSVINVNKSLNLISGYKQLTTAGSKSSKSSETEINLLILNDDAIPGRLKDSLDEDFV